MMIRPELNRKQKIEFLKLVSRMASSSEFERKLDMSRSDIEFYKREMDIESADEARRAYKRMELEGQEAHEARVIEETKKQREAEAVANRRLAEINRERAKKAAENRPDVDKAAIKQQDAERQRRFAKEQEKQETKFNRKHNTWSLPLEGSKEVQNRTKERFRTDILHHGLRFCASKYDATASQIKAEAVRLELNINWDRVRR